MANKKLRFQFIVICMSLFVGIIKVNSQTKKEVSLYNFFDESVGRENLNVNNGLLYIDFYNTKKDDNCFLISKSFEKGDVSYDGQPYYDLNINYDIFKDNLIFETINGKTKTEYANKKQRFS